MWLINTTTLTLESFVDPVEQGISYAILSHTWRQNEEVSMQEFADLQIARGKRGFDKIERTCQLAQAEGLSYAWVDTCCIDKTNSAELTESINSMFQWYKSAAVCFAYLDDLASTSHTGQPRSHKPSAADLQQCRWFTRGFTLQELIAPSRVDFYNQAWLPVGDKLTLCKAIEEVTGIDQDVLLNDTDPSLISVSDRMCWAAGRDTTRVEDTAYCLLGIFDINLPLIYGEGYKAFQRLQVEIARTINDPSIFAWSSKTPVHHKHWPPVYKTRTSSWHRGPFAWSPFEFLDGKSSLEAARHVSWVEKYPDRHPPTSETVPTEAMIRSLPTIEFEFASRSGINISGVLLMKSHTTYADDSWLVGRCSHLLLCRPVRVQEGKLVFLDESRCLLPSELSLVQSQNKNSFLIQGQDEIARQYVKEAFSTEVGIGWANYVATSPFSPARAQCLFPHRLWDYTMQRFLPTRAQMGRQLDQPDSKVLGAVMHTILVKPPEDFAPSVACRVVSWFGLAPMADPNSNGFSDRLVWGSLIAHGNAEDVTSLQLGRAPPLSQGKTARTRCFVATYGDGKLLKEPKMPGYTELQALVQSKPALHSASVKKSNSSGVSSGFVAISLGPDVVYRVSARCDIAETPSQDERGNLKSLKLEVRLLQHAPDEYIPVSRFENELEPELRVEFAVGEEDIHPPLDKENAFRELIEPDGRYWPDPYRIPSTRTAKGKGGGKNAFTKMFG